MAPGMSIEALEDALAEGELGRARRLVEAADIEDVAEACEWLDALVFSRDEAPEVRGWIPGWLARIAERAATEDPRPAATAALFHSTRQTADALPELAARCAAMWDAWASRLADAPAARAAIARRRPGLTWAELAAAGAEDRAWILGAAPLPFGPNDERENADGRNGYADSDVGTVRAALAALELGPEDLVYDLGSGLGIPCFVGALATPARFCGIEFHAAYVERARRTAHELGLADRVSFIAGDAATAAWPGATRIYMFNPFPAAVLALVAARIAALGPGVRVACFHNELPLTCVGGEGAMRVYTT